MLSMAFDRRPRGQASNTRDIFKESQAELLFVSAAGSLRQGGSYEELPAGREANTRSCETFMETKV